MTRLERLLQDLALRLPEREIRKAGEVILAFRELSTVPVSPLYPRNFHPLLRLRKRLGGIDKEVLVSPIDLSIITNANMPAWKRIFDFHLDTDFVERTSIRGVECLLVGNKANLRRVYSLLSNLIPAMREPPRKIYSLGDEVYLKFEGDRFVKLKMIGSTLELEPYNIPLSQLSRIFGRATFILDSLFHAKNAAFYRLLFAVSLDTFGHFYEFFMKHVYPKLPPEHREFLEEMHDYRNFLQLLYFNLSRMNIDRVEDEVGIIIRRRSRPERPLELGILFREGRVEVSDRVSRAQINLLV
ncbi:hypothetical protein A3L04_07725 [Thermococcus chitonophagus]|uniref:Uncharacterized protein n=1 Tax=Thermococcus chitonophagus TaxID=54262 RepID=A0A160VTE5_9EURY|nr:hypothetical protein [Thermococcus chitonophagus]ASJ16971.1 hypothetical protein A3L04_07725 [Thermococcus chitonophagus]CUX78453.1 hypothetical protein CHITON_1674 [Thermococcus chitonophagus]